jgi:hypothetical protein
MEDWGNDRSQEMVENGDCRRQRTVKSQAYKRQKLETTDS